ncbi:DUF7079 family protein [Pseudozobellia thermophila]|uniref:DUF7079 family protein n=1 Tax=Pseudozobellia thermophila TaxID=192903 RepID=UPI0011149476|nr:hypothetical protein [Pseudozobellia thermophila]
MNIEERKPIWTALSEFYRDTELQDADFRYMARKILESPYSFEEVRVIDKYEVFPVLRSNLMDVAGVWAGFKEEWLVNKIRQSLSKRSAVKIIEIETSYRALKWMNRDYWGKLEKVYNEIKSNTL